MLTTSQKANILAKAGVTVPAFPARRLPVQEKHLLKGSRAPQEERDADAEQAQAVQRWNQQVEAAYAGFVAARAARSLRESEEALQNDRLRKANSVPSRDRGNTADADTDFDVP